jgi:quercetin dioxygenase-like cupin family protein
MKVVHLNDVPVVPVQMEGAAKASKQLPIGSADGSPNFSFRVFSLAPGGHTPYHRHAAEHVNYIIEGAGELVREDGSTIPLKAGDFALVLPNELHQYRNVSPTATMRMICAVPVAYE